MRSELSPSSGEFHIRNANAFDFSIACPSSFQIVISCPIVSNQVLFEEVEEGQEEQWTSARN